MKAPRWRSIIDLDMYAGTLAFHLMFSAITLWGTVVFLPLDWLLLDGLHVATALRLLAVLSLLNAAIVTAIVLRVRSVQTTFASGTTVSGQVKKIVIVKQLWSDIVNDRVLTVAFHLNESSFYRTYSFTEAILERHQHIRDLAVDDSVTVVLRDERPRRAFVVDFFVNRSEDD